MSVIYYSTRLHSIVVRCCWLCNHLRGSPVPSLAAAAYSIVLPLRLRLQQLLLLLSTTTLAG